MRYIRRARIANVAEIIETVAAASSVAGWAIGMLGLEPLKNPCPVQKIVH
jgi:hypothetical protein